MKTLPFLLATLLASYTARAGDLAVDTLTAKDVVINPTPNSNGQGFNEDANGPSSSLTARQSKAPLCYFHNSWHAANGSTADSAPFLRLLNDSFGGAAITV